MSTISEIVFDTERLRAGDRRIFCILEDSKVLACDGAKAVDYATGTDENEVVAFQRYLDNKPDEFFLVEVRPQVSEVLAAGETDDAPTIGEGTSYNSTLTPMDRARMRNIVRKHASFYFAQAPSLAQIDQLIESIGPIAAEKCVRKAIAGGGID